MSSLPYPEFLDELYPTTHKFNINLKEVNHMRDFTPQELRNVADYLKANTSLSDLAVEKIRKQAEVVEQRERQKLDLYRLATKFFNAYKNTAHGNDWLNGFDSFDTLPDWKQNPILDSLQFALEENGYKRVS